MGTVFEELVRKFNEDNNEEAGEHWTPRDAVRLMANLVLLPIEDKIKSGTYLLYDCACGTGGMLTVAEETLTALAAKHKQDVIPCPCRHPRESGEYSAAVVRISISRITGSPGQAGRRQGRSPYPPIFAISASDTSKLA